ncbi:MAG: hypothetical protein WBA57_22195 [Elainellaceae cyanobacterium]
MPDISYEMSGIFNYPAMIVVNGNTRRFRPLFSPIAFSGSLIPIDPMLLDDGAIAP